MQLWRINTSKSYLLPTNGYSVAIYDVAFPTYDFLNRGRLCPNLSNNSFRHSRFIRLRVYRSFDSFLDLSSKKSSEAKHNKQRLL